MLQANFQGTCATNLSQKRDVTKSLIHPNIQTRVIQNWCSSYFFTVNERGAVLAFLKIWTNVTLRLKDQSLPLQKVSAIECAELLCRSKIIRWQWRVLQLVESAKIHPVRVYRIAKIHTDTGTPSAEWSQIDTKECCDVSLKRMSATRMRESCFVLRKSFDDMAVIFTLSTSCLNTWTASSARGGLLLLNDPKLIQNNVVGPSLKRVSASECVRVALSLDNHWHDLQIQHLLLNLGKATPTWV